MRAGIVGYLSFIIVLSAAWMAHAEDEKFDSINDTLAEPKASWMPRWLTSPFKKSPAQARKEEPEKIAQVKTTALRPSLKNKQAEADLYRRLEVCLKLQEIGAKTGNQELESTALQLRTRAFENYQRKIRNSPKILADPMETFLLEQNHGRGAVKLPKNIHSQNSRTELPGVQGE